MSTTPTSKDTNSYTERFKEECNNAFGNCLTWDKFKDSFKSKKPEGAPKPTMVELQQQKQQIEAQLEVERENFEADKENLREQMAGQKEEFRSKLSDQYQELNTQIELLQVELAQRSLALQNVSDMVQQYEFLVPDYSKLKRDRAEYTTPPMYTWPGGYKFVITVAVSGVKIGLGSHISISTISQVGEYDANLTFPAKNMLLTLQLLNQQDKKEFHEVTVSLTYPRSKHGEFLGANFQYISHQHLERNAAIYLKDDKLWFRISQIKIDTTRHHK